MLSDHVNASVEEAAEGCVAAADELGTEPGGDRQPAVVDNV